MYTMAVYQLSLTVIVITLLVIPLADGEIHRTTLKTGVPNRFSQDVASETRSAMSDPEAGRTFYEVLVYSVGGAVLVGLSGIFPLLVIPIEAGPALKHGAAANKLKLLLSFAVGGLLGDVFLHLLPEAWAAVDKGGHHDHFGHTKIGLWVLAGILSFLIIEKVFAKEGEFDHMHDDCDSDDEEEDNYNRQISDLPKINGCDLKQRTSTSDNHKTNYKKQNHRVTSSQKTASAASSKQHTSGKQEGESDIKVSGYLNLLANVIDNFTHGLAVGGSFLVSNKVGFVTTLAILLHEIPHEVGDFAILLRSGFNRWKAAKAQMMTATGGILGVITALTAESAESAGESTAWILPFTSGGFIYIALVTVVPDLLDEKHTMESLKQLLCLCGGILAMLLVSLFH
ncbi:zinc transporter ZIP13-like [Saccostrea echinata]|uniref:zinc transporter ZIP13-like n=1 Tax=Saccostrea echinata TaxID=191078 RepID=UPI002A83905A|nr:zinc transporter ZIP13-like [Saccostrea echinata]